MRLLVAVASLLLGAVTGVGVVALHSLWWGLLLGLATTTAISWVLPAGWWARLPFAMGWSVVVWLAMTPRAEGDYVIAADAPGYLVLVAALVLMVVAVATLGRRGRHPVASPRSGPAHASSVDRSSPT